MVTDPVQRALDRAAGREWPASRDHRIALAISDRRLLAREVLRLQRLLNEADAPQKS